MPRLPLGFTPPPSLKDARSAEDGVRIAGERVELLDCLGEFVLRCEAVRDHGLGYVLQSHTDEKFDPALKRGRLNQPHLYIFETNLAKEPGQAWSNVRIGPAVLHCLAVKLDRSRESTTVWLSEVPAVVNVFDDDNTARTHMRTDGGDQSCRVGEVGQEKPRVDDVEQFAWLPRGDVAGLEYDL